MEAMNFSQLLVAVSHRLEVVADHKLRARDPAEHLQKLKEAAAQLDALVTTLPADCDPQLRHFLERQSYAKALDWLQARSDSSG